MFFKAAVKSYDLIQSLSFYHNKSNQKVQTSVAIIHPCLLPLCLVGVFSVTFLSPVDHWTNVKPLAVTASSPTGNKSKVLLKVKSSQRKIDYINDRGNYSVVT